MRLNSLLNTLPLLPLLPTTIAAPTPSGVTTSNFSFSGSGCPTGTAQYYLTAPAAANSQLVLIFEGFSVDYRIGEISKKCSLSLDINVPSGRQFSVGVTDYAGWAVVDSGYSVGISSSTKIGSSTVSLASPLLHLHHFLNFY